jgi:hypothetical protein
MWYYDERLRCVPIVSGDFVLRVEEIVTWFKISLLHSFVK